MTDHATTVRASRARRHRRIALAAKRAFDIVVSSAALVLCAPLLIVATGGVKASSPGPVFFRQSRRGRGGRVFVLYKFRTMADRPRAPQQQVMPGAAEVTAVGAVLRRLKIDELPQLWNVLKGDMSIVGPRPDLPDMPLSELGERRLEVRPGLTGLAQVNGNVYLPWEERWKYDAAYVDRLSFSLDLWVLWRTVLVVLLGEKRFARRLQEPAARADEAPSRAAHE